MPLWDGVEGGLMVRLKGLWTSHASSPGLSEVLTQYPEPEPPWATYLHAQILTASHHAHLTLQLLRTGFL